MTRYKKRLQTRLIAAGALVLASFISAFVLSSVANQKSGVWTSSKTLVPGHYVLIEDLVQTQVVLGGSESSYFRASDDPTGYIVKRAVPQGELIPRSSLSNSENEMLTSAVPISVHASDLPGNVSSGEIVNLYQVGDSTITQNLGPPTLILSHVFLLSIDKKGENFGGDISLTISVDHKEILTLLEATSQGRIVVVRVNG